MRPTKTGEGVTREGSPFSLSCVSLQERLWECTSDYRQDLRCCLSKIEIKIPHIKMQELREVSYLLLCLFTSQQAAGMRMHPFYRFHLNENVVYSCTKYDNPNSP